MKPANYFVITVSYVAALLLFAFSLSLAVRRLPDVSQTRENSQIWVYSGHAVSQTFTPQNNGLTLVTVYLKNVSLRNQEPLQFSLSDASGVIRKVSISGYNVGDGDNVRFQFAPIMDSQNRTFSFTLSSGSVQDLAIGAGFSESTNSLAFQTYYYPTSRLAVLKASLQYFFVSLFQPGLILLFLSLSGLLIFPLVRLYSGNFKK